MTTVVAPIKEPKQHSPNWGGARRRTRAVTINSLKNEVLTLRSKYGVMPLDHMLKALNQPLPDIPENIDLKDADAVKERDRLIVERKEIIGRQDWAAEHAAPYLHAKLASIEVTTAGRDPVKHPVDLRKLSDKELDALETLVNKATMTPEEVTLDESQYTEINE
jgi:hypothetical protein